MTSLQRWFSLLIGTITACGARPDAPVAEVHVPSPLLPASAAPAPSVAASAAPTPSVAAVPPTLPAAPAMVWSPLDKSESELKKLEGVLRFDADATNAYWDADGKLFTRPLAGGGVRVVSASPPVRKLAALVKGRAFVESTAPVALWAVSLDGSAPPAKGGEIGHEYALEGEQLWVAGSDAIWRFDAPAQKVKSHDNHEAFTLDADAFYFRDQSRKIVALDRKRGTLRVLAANAASDIALDGDSVLWIKLDPQEPGAEMPPSHRTITRTPKGGGRSRAVTSAEEPCGLWIVGDALYFFGQGSSYHTTALYRVPRGGASEPDWIGATPYMSTFFGCRGGAQLVGQVLYWGSKSGWLFRANLAAAHPTIEGLAPEARE